MESTIDSQSVTFIIPHKGREHLLESTLESIVALDTSGFDVDVVVISQNPEDTFSSKFTGRLNLSIHHVPDSWTISKARNFGVSQTSAEFLAFLDADIALSSNWLQTLSKELTSTESLLISAIQSTYPEATTLEQIRTSLSNIATHCYVDFLPGRNLLMKHSTFLKVNGFPEHLATCEDYYFTNAIAQHGKLFYSSSTSYIHLGEDKAFKAMYKKEIWRGQSNLASLKGRRIPLRELPSFIVPPAILIGFFISANWVFFINVQIGILLLIISLLPIIIYSARLYGHVPQGVSFWSILQFYATYFPARAVGTIRGMFKTLQWGE